MTSSMVPNVQRGCAGLGNGRQPSVSPRESAATPAVTQNGEGRATPDGVETRRLGRSDLEVGTLALGTMMFGAWGNPDAAECGRMVDAALDAGVTLFDTADMYDVG